MSIFKNDPPVHLTDKMLAIFNEEREKFLAREEFLNENGLVARIWPLNESYHIHGEYFAADVLFNDGKRERATFENVEEAAKWLHEILIECEWDSYSRCWYIGELIAPLL